MNPILCLIGECNGAGNTTLARELFPLVDIRRFLNADEIARGLSPLEQYRRLGIKVTPQMTLAKPSPKA